MEYNPLQHIEATWMILHFFCVQIKKKKKKIDLPTLPIFRSKEQTNLLFSGLISVSLNCLWLSMACHVLIVCISSNAEYTSHKSNHHIPNSFFPDFIIFKSVNIKTHPECKMANWQAMNGLVNLYNQSNNKVYWKLLALCWMRSRKVLK